MLVTRTSILSGIERTLDLPVTQTQLNRWKSGEKIQSVMSHLTPEQREFMISGITEEEWNTMLPPEE